MSATARYSSADELIRLLLTITLWIICPPPPECLSSVFFDFIYSWNNKRPRAGAGVACVGMGSNLITKELLQAGDYQGIAANIRNTLELIRKIRGK